MVTSRGGGEVTTISGVPHYVVPTSAAITVTVNNAVVTNKGNVSTTAMPTKSVVPASGAGSLRALGGVVVGVLGLGLALVWV